jgi:hypothetical protein
MQSHETTYQEHHLYYLSCVFLYFVSCIPILTELLIFT